MIEKIARRTRRALMPTMERLFRALEKPDLSRGGQLVTIPHYRDRVGGGGLGTTTYSEWCYTIGLFQGILSEAFPDERPIRMLDVGCGTGRLLLAAKTNLTDDDRYVGLDINKASIDACCRHYKEQIASFFHYEAPNAYYSDGSAAQVARWPFDDGSFNFVSALSVWTHLAETDWRHYLSEVVRVLRPSGRAMISFFILDDDYEKALPMKDSRISNYYPQPKNKWIFDKTAYDSADWLCPSWAKVPEVAIGVPYDRFVAETTRQGLIIHKYYSGSWKERPSIFFQDIVLFQKL